METNLTRNHEDEASLSGLRFQCCRELSCRSQMWLGSDVAVAVVLAGGCTSYWTPSMGTSIGAALKIKKKKVWETQSLLQGSLSSSR